MATLKLFSLLVAWGAVVAVLSRRYSHARMVLTAGAASGFIAGVVGQNLLLGFMGSALAFQLLRGAGGMTFIAFWALSVAALYRAGGASRRGPAAEVSPDRSGGTWIAAAAAVATGVLAGAISLAALAFNITGSVALLPSAALAVAGAAMAVAASSLGGRLPALFSARDLVPQGRPDPTFPAPGGGGLGRGNDSSDDSLPPSQPPPSGGRSSQMSPFNPGHFSAQSAPVAALVISGILFMACSVQRTDLFSPLTMEVMKFIHDFVHQFFESMLIPDHPFFRSDVWDYIGILFSDKVGLWGGLIIWLTPVFLVLLAVRLQRLPSVAHIRQGAQRRKLLASFIRNRRLQLVLPLIALVFLTAAVYRSRFPAVEYWDPKPLPVSADASGEILIPIKGEVDLEDGKLHKYLLKQNGREVRFFVLMTPAGRFTVDLDACAICKPDGYGQTGDTVICYYCKTLIPLASMGKPGGCNPVPIPFVTKGNAVSVSSTALVGRWSDTIQETVKVKGGGK